MRVFFFDLETYLFGPGNMLPKPVSIAWADGYTRGLELACEIPRILGPVLESAARGETLICAFPSAFDLGVVMAHFPQFTHLIFEAYAQNRVTCVRLREKLLDIATDELRQSHDSDGNTIEHKYNLADVSKRRLGVEMSKGEDTYRKRYADLDGIPISRWPKPAVDYAYGDLIGRNLFFHQEERARQIGYTIPTQFDDARADFALRLMTTWGVHTDYAKVDRLYNVTLDRMEELARILVQHKLARSKGGQQEVMWGPREKPAIQKKMAAIRALIEQHYPREVEIPRTEKKNEIQTGKDVLAVCHHPALDALAEFNTLQKTGSTYALKLFDGVEYPIHSFFDAVGAATDRTSSSHPNLQNLPRLPGVRECFQARHGKVFLLADYDTQEMRTWAQSCLDIVNHSRLVSHYKQDPDFDPHMLFASEFYLKCTPEEGLRLKKAGDEQALEYRQRAKVCFHPDTEALTRKRGWVKIGDLTYDDEVAAAYPQTHGDSIIAWEKPTHLTRRKAPNQKLVHLKNEGMDLRVTEDHRMLGFRANGNPYVTTPEKMNLARRWGNAGVLTGGDLPGGDMHWRLLRLAVATQADGSYRRPQKNVISFGFSRQRKIRRMRKLLKEACRSDEDWTETITHRKTARTFTLSKKLSARIQRLLDPDKTIPWWWARLPKAMRETILDELPHWDGHVITQRRFSYCSTIQKNVDVLQALAVVTGRKARRSKDERRKAHHADPWKLSIGDHAYSRGENLDVKKRRYIKDVVCLSVPSSYVLVRDRGVPVIVGQCNFGYPGGLGPFKFIAYAKGYGLNLTMADSKKAKEGWQQTWPEQKDYFGFVRAVIGSADYGRLIIPRTGFRREGVGHNDCANTPFQHLAAKASKSALWEVTRRCYDPAFCGVSWLYGSRVVNFVHDELNLEVDPAIGHEVACEIEQVMADAQQKWTPDVPARASASLSTVWSKKVKRIVGPDGRIGVWSPKEKVAA